MARAQQPPEHASHPAILGANQLKQLLVVDILQLQRYSSLSGHNHSPQPRLATMMAVEHQRQNRFRVPVRFSIRVHVWLRCMWCGSWGFGAIEMAWKANHFLAVGILG